MTTLKRVEDIQPVYRTLIEALNEQLYSQKLFEDPTLFVWDQFSTFPNTKIIWNKTKTPIDFIPP